MDFAMPIGRQISTARIMFWIGCFALWLTAVRHSNQFGGVVIGVLAGIVFL
jgi:hypothetical protein